VKPERKGAHWELDAGDLEPGALLQCGASTTYVLVTGVEHDGDDVLVTTEALMPGCKPARTPATERVRVSLMGWHPAWSSEDEQGRRAGPWQAPARPGEGQYMLRKSVNIADLTAEARGHARGRAAALRLPVAGTTGEADGAVLFGAAYGHAAREYASGRRGFLPSIQAALLAWELSGGTAIDDVAGAVRGDLTPAEARQVGAREEAVVHVPGTPAGLGDPHVRIGNGLGQPVIVTVRLAQKDDR
jgi:hypothetical protein